MEYLTLKIHTTQNARFKKVVHTNHTFGWACIPPEVKIMARDAAKAGLNLEKDCRETNEWGWCTIPLPDKASINGRMHLNQKQAKILAKQLLYFSRHGCLNAKVTRLWEGCGDEKI